MKRHVVLNVNGEEYRIEIEPNRLLLQDREDRKVFLEDRVHLGAVDYSPGLYLVGHLFLGEWGADILG